MMKYLEKNIGKIFKKYLDIVSYLGYNKEAVWRCGCSSMVESQPSKLIVRVRFPLPAPM